MSGPTFCSAVCPFLLVTDAVDWSPRSEGDQVEVRSPCESWGERELFTARDVVNTPSVLFSSFSVSASQSREAHSSGAHLLKIKGSIQSISRLQSNSLVCISHNTKTRLYLYSRTFWILQKASMNLFNVFTLFIYSVPLGITRIAVHTAILHGATWLTVPQRTPLILFGQLGPRASQLHFNCPIFFFFLFIYLYGKLFRNLICQASKSKFCH